MKNGRSALLSNLTSCPRCSRLCSPCTAPRSVRKKGQRTPLMALTSTAISTHTHFRRKRTMATVQLIDGRIVEHARLTDVKQVGEEGSRTATAHVGDQTYNVYN